MQLCGFLRAATCTVVVVVVLAQSSHSLPGSTFRVSAWVTSFDPHCNSLRTVLLANSILSMRKLSHIVNAQEGLAYYWY